MRPQATTSFLALLALVCLGGAPTAGADDPTSAADRLLEEIGREDHLPSISVAVSRRGKLLYSRAVGFADLEHRVEATAETVYPVGSIAKSFTAVAALQLAEREELDLDAPVRKYCGRFPERLRPVSVRQLLAHTGGIRHYDYRRFEEDYLNRRHFGSIEEALAKFVDDPPHAEPGAEYHYSSWGYVLIGCAIEGASGRPYADYIESQIVAPAGLSRTRLDVVGDLVLDRARGYANTDAGSWVNAGLFDASDRYPAGGLLSTPRDLTRFVAALFDGKLLGEGARGTMWSSARLASGEETGQGLGWKLSEDDDAVFHGGATVGATAFLYIQPGEQKVVAIATNLSLWSRDRLELARRLSALFSSVE